LYYFNETCVILFQFKVVTALNIGVVVF